ncbi:MAG: hypothetical protein DRJ56_05755 [Thermoprotei archaeon]|nr:MAG: hypothetical protein DRJ56_05755 [Thermoprotei archaeon]
MSPCYLGPAREVLHVFERLCWVRYGNSPRTVEDQSRALAKVLSRLRIPGYVSREDLEVALAGLSKGERVHAVKAVRKLFRALGRPDMVEGLKVPSYGPRRWHIPSDRALKRFYKALDRGPYKLAFRLLAETGLRKGEVLTARVGDIDWRHMALLPVKASATKKTGIGFLTADTARMLEAHLRAIGATEPHRPIWPYRSDEWLRKAFRRAEARTGVHVCPQALRVRFADKCGEAGVPDRYVDIMQGRAPRSVLARHYTPSGLKKLRRLWLKAMPLLTAPYRA